MGIKKLCNFRKISDVDVNSQSTWEGPTTFLTFDIDWAHDDIIRDTMRLLANSNACATFFVTHDTPVLNELRAQPLFELGLHPNFNKILNVEDCHLSANDVVKNLKAIVPEATAVRSHSTTFSSQLCNIFAKNGLSHDCNFFIPDFSQIELKPWKNWLGMTMVPYFWEDDVACLDMNVAPVFNLIEREGIRVFDFHPIHVYLNTESMARYEATKSMHHHPEELKKYRYEGFGARSQLIHLLEANQR